MKSIQEQLLRIKESLQPSKLENITSPKNNNKTLLPAKNRISYMRCPKCNCKLRTDRLSKHMKIQHGLILKTKQDITHNSKNTSKIKDCQKKSNKINNKPSQSKKRSESIRKNKTNSVTPEHRQLILARINQGRFDFESKLLNLLKNAADRDEVDIINAANQRLKIVAPNTYRKQVGPLNIRDPLGNKECFCGKPASLNKIADQITTWSISNSSLLCDDCWREDICSAWGFYGTYGKKTISKDDWQTICDERAKIKYATY